MAKGTRSGVRRARTSSPTINVKNAQPTAQPTISANFYSLDDDGRADVINKAIAQGVPTHLSDNSLQKLLYNMELGDKPDVVDDATFKKLAKGQKVLYRTVNDVKDYRHNMYYSAPNIAKQILGGTYTRVSDSGGSAYGRGIYFADDRSSSTSYGNYKNNVNKTAVIKAILGTNARTIDYSKAKAGAGAEITKGTKLGKVLAKVDYSSQPSIYALAKGYNVITTGGWGGYYNVLNRSALTMSNKIDPK